MDPALMMMLLNLVGTFAEQGTKFGGKEGERSSSRNEGQVGLINDAVNSIKGMQGNQDITKNPAYGQGMDWLLGMFNDPSFFNKFEAPLQRQFQEQTVPELANRFASMGTGGSTGSTGFRNQLAREGSNLSTNIAALRGGMMQNAIPQLLGYAQQPFSNLMSLYNQALTPTQDVYQQPSAGLFGGMLPGVVSGWMQSQGQQMGNNRFPGQSPLTG